MNDDALAHLARHTCARCGEPLDDSSCRACGAPSPWTTRVAPAPAVPDGGCLGCSAPLPILLGALALLWRPLWFVAGPALVALGVVVIMHFVTGRARHVLIGVKDGTAQALVRARLVGARTAGRRATVGAPHQLPPTLADALRAIPMEEAVHVARALTAGQVDAFVDGAVARAGDRAFIALSLGNLVARGYLELRDVVIEDWTRAPHGPTVVTAARHEACGVALDGADLGLLTHQLERESLDRLIAFAASTFTAPDGPPDELPRVRTPPDAATLFASTIYPDERRPSTWNEHIYGRFPASGAEALARARVKYEALVADPAYRRWEAFVFEGDVRSARASGPRAHGVTPTAG